LKKKREDTRVSPDSSLTLSFVSAYRYLNGFSRDLLYKNNKIKFDVNKRKKIEENIANLKKIRDYDFNHKIVKEIMKKLNLLSYNRRNIIQKTWRNENDDDTDDDYFAKLTNDDENKIEYVEVYDNDNMVPYLVEKNSESSSDITPLVIRKSIKPKSIEI
jgi:hypothetical protein